MGYNDSYNNDPVPLVQTYDVYLSNVFMKSGTEYVEYLDSDTRDYVLKHTKDSRTRQDVVDCINKLHLG